MRSRSHCTEAEPMCGSESKCGARAKVQNRSQSVEPEQRYRAGVKVPSQSQTAELEPMCGARAKVSSRNQCVESEPTAKPKPTWRARANRWSQSQGVGRECGAKVNALSLSQYAGPEPTCEASVSG